MAEDTQNNDNTPSSQAQSTSNGKTSGFLKGMLKDFTDIYVPDGVWINAINAINITHNGEQGAIGNEPSNQYCASAPYTVIGILSIIKTKWVVFSTDNVSSEIGIFDEADCSYTTLVNDPCLNFNTQNLITGAVKENYDCTYSAYWQDNRNPDRTMNLDPTRIPYICYPQTIDVHKIWNQYTISRATETNPCGVATNAGGPGVTNTVHALGESFGVVTITYDMYSIPDQMDVWFDANPATDPPTVSTGGPVSGTGSLSFNKFTTTSTCYVRITGPTGTAWNYTVNCPVVTPETPPQPVILSGIYYEDIYGNIVELPGLTYGQSVTICALTGSFDTTLMPADYTISAPGAICKETTETIPDPDACGAQICTDSLDCDQLRLHPYVNQACVTISKSKGSGQLNNGSYQAVVAYSENGIRLSDYSMPSNAQSLWDHTGMGGSLNIEVGNLDQNFNEYELVVISVVNQQTIAKRIGFYSINQKHVHLDLFQQSLVTVDLALIPLKNAIYEKSEKMFDIGGYLIRSSVTTQPFFNYQPYANNIVTKWVAVEYPASYYWNGGHETGYMRDEVYAFFIRWVYKTGARSASYHIPGRASLPSDLTLVSPINENIIDLARRHMWQVYDTSTRTTTTGTTPDGGTIVATGDMAYWESTEHYPNEHPEIWGDLCNQPIRHHKMPSNETTHIHNTTGDKIYLLGVEFSNIKQPKDESGNFITDIVGYEILRGSREGNRTIVSKGLFNNMVEYDIPFGSGGGKTGLYQNYPYNDLRADLYMDPASNVHVRRDIFTFHSPENNIVKPYVGAGGYIKIYTEEKGDVIIQNEIPYKHPKFKFMNNDAFAAASGLAFGTALLTLFGKQTVNSTSTGHTDTSEDAWIAPYGAGTVIHAANPLQTWDNSITQGSDGGTANVASGAATNGILAGINASLSGVTGWLSLTQTIFDFVIATETATMAFYEALDQYLEVIYHFLKFKDHILQGNSHGFYNDFVQVNDVAVPPGVQPSFTRVIQGTSAKYVTSGLQDYEGTFIINNLNRNKHLALSLLTGKTLPDPVTIDTTRTLYPTGDNDNSLIPYVTKTSAYYGALKYDFENQYGQLNTIVQLPTHSCVSFTPNYSDAYTSNVIFGGDVYINRYTEKNPFYYFNTWMFDMPNGTEFNYQNYVNGPLPAYWMDTRRYDASLFDVHVDWSEIYPQFYFNNPSGYYSFYDWTQHDYGLGFRGKMFLFNNGVRDFFTESELNMAFRDYGEKDEQRFYDVYGNSFSDLHTMFRSDLIKTPIFYQYDLSLSASKLYSNFTSWGSVLPRDYDPVTYTSCFEYYPKRVIYSLQQQSGLKRDNWRNFLQLNYKDWKGKVNNIKALNAQGALILFEDLEPMQFVGIDTFTSAAGVKYTLGDGGLFMQNMQSIVNADDAFEYGTSNSYHGVVNTPYGLFWMSQKTGKICVFSGQNMDEISKNGMKHWFLNNLPSELLKVYPDYPLYDNPVAGIGCQAIFDSQYDLIYFSKRDYKPLRNDLQFDDPSGVPYYNCSSPIGRGTKCPCAYDNPLCFEKIEWTISYDPKIKAWLSFHDWHPTFMMPSYNHFLTVDGNTFWRHNVRNDSFANFYAKDYPWEIELPVTTANNVTTLRSFEYYMETHKYYNDGRDFNHVFDNNFDRAIVYNSEQISGLLKLNFAQRNNPVNNLAYPVPALGGIDILYSNVENKLRFNQFYDITNDRGMTTGSTVPMWISSANGYQKAINPAYVDYFKVPLQHKRFRHYGNKVILRKNVSDDKKMILKLVNTKLLNSPR